MVGPADVVQPASASRRPRSRYVALPREQRGWREAPRCPPLGFSGAAPCTLGRFTLAPGETLWLFTDGLVESRRRSLDDGLAALARAAGDATGTIEEIADRLLVDLPASRDDDIALLGLRRVGEVR